MITFGVTAWPAYRKYRNVSFELTDTAVKFRNGTHSYNQLSNDRVALCEMAIPSGLRRLAKNHHWWFSLSSPTLKILTSLSPSENTFESAK